MIGFSEGSIWSEGSQVRFRCRRGCSSWGIHDDRFVFLLCGRIDNRRILLDGLAWWRGVDPGVAGDESEKSGGGCEKSECFHGDMCNRSAIVMPWGVTLPMLTTTARRSGAGLLLRTRALVTVSHVPGQTVTRVAGPNHSWIRPSSRSARNDCLREAFSTLQPEESLVIRREGREWNLSFPRVVA